MGEEISLFHKSFSVPKYHTDFFENCLKTSFFFSFASTQLFLIYFKVNVRALSRVSWFSPNSKVKNTVKQTIISFDYHNFLIFLKIWIRQYWTPSSRFFCAILCLLLFLSVSKSPPPYHVLSNYSQVSSSERNWESMAFV